MEYEDLFRKAFMNTVLCFAAFYANAILPLVGGGLMVSTTLLYIAIFAAILAILRPLHVAYVEGELWEEDYDVISIRSGRSKKD